MKTGQNVRINLGRPLSDLGSDDRFAVTVTINALTYDNIDKNQVAPVTYDPNGYRINIKPTQAIFDEYAHLV